MNQPEALRISRKGIRAVRITRIGWAFILLNLGLGVAALNTGNNLLYLVFGMLLSMLISNAILSTSTLHQLQIQFHFPERLFVGNENPIRITIRNLKRKIPSFAITLLATDGAGSNFFFKISAQEQVEAIHYPLFPRRGTAPYPSYRIATSFPFGLIEKYIPLPLKGNCVVYPKLRRLDSDLLGSSLWRGEFLAGQRGTGVNPYGIREFHYGDDWRHVHWRSFAKKGNWMIKEFEQEKQSRVTLHLQVRAKAGEETQANQQREEAISTTASLLMHFVELNRQVDLTINNQAIAPQSGRGYVDFYLSALALFDDPKMGLTPWQAAHTQTSNTTVWIHESKPHEFEVRA